MSGDVVPVGRVDGRGQCPYGREGRLRQERDRHCEEFESLRPVYRAYSNPRNGSLVRGPALKGNRIEASSSERCLNPVDVGPS